MSIKKELLELLEERRSACLAGGGEDRIGKHHAKGAMTARERFDVLFDPGSFLEWGMHVQHGCHDFGMQDKSLPGDGVVTGIGQIGGRAVAGFSPSSRQTSWKPPPLLSACCRANSSTRRS